MENVNEKTSSEETISENGMPEEKTPSVENVTPDLKEDEPGNNTISAEDPESVLANEEIQPSAESPKEIPNDAPQKVVDEVLPVTEIEEHPPVPEEHHEELEIEPLENYADFTKEQLVARMQELCEVPEFNTVKSKVFAIRDAFNIITAEQRAVALSKFLEDGGVKEEFDFKGDALEDRFNESLKKFNKRRSEYILSQEKIRAENLKSKQAILGQMKHIIQHEEDMSKAFNEFHDLQARWRGIGPVPPQNINDLWMTYRLYIERFYDYIKLNRELQDLDQKKNLEMKMQLCEQAEELMLEPSLNKAIQAANQLQNKWKDIGVLPRDKRTEVWARFKAAVDKVYERKKSFLDELKHKHSGNLAAKNALIVKAEELVNQPIQKHQQWQETMKALLELQQEWRKIGPADKESNDEVWKRFKSVSDQFFKNKDEYYHKKKQEYAANMQQKTELCMQAEGLKESHDWKNTANELIRLQQEWKKIGPVGSSEKNEKIWNRFRQACDAFFQLKKSHFADQDQQQDVNYAKKLELIETVEKYTVGENAGEALEELKNFQRQFTEIGLVPLAKKDDIYNRFRKAIQVHFNGLKSKPEYRQGFNTRNEQHHTSRTDNGHAPASGDERGIVHKMNKLKEEVTVLENNIGFFAKSKGANALKEEYELKIQQAKDEIAKLKEKLKEIKSAS